jgi:hypothetical protein
LGKFYGPDFPVPWVPPAELAKPAVSPVDNLAIRMLSSNLIGNDSLEALGLYLAADARFNVWYGQGAGLPNPTGRELVELMVFRMDVFRRVYEAWCGLADSAADGGPSSGAAYEALLGALRTGVAEICARMGESLADFGDL